VTTLVALYRRPPGGDDELAAFERSYAETHLPLVVEAPGLRRLRIRRVRRALMGDSDLALVAEMEFDDWESLKTALNSDAMRRAGENLAAIARGGVTLLVAEDAPDLLPAPWRSGAGEG
jgi:uncharacterized protein (TIGR02118 family)